MTQTKESVADVGLARHLDAVRRDVRFALRTLRTNPGFATTAILSLAVGIGASTAIFSVLDAVRIAPLPYPHAERLVGIWEKRPDGQRSAMSTLNYLDYARESTVFERLAATTGCCAYVMLGEGDAPARLTALHVSPSYFDVLGAAAALGRTFVAGEDQPSHDHVVVLSHKLWAARFGADVGLVGRTIRLDDEPYTVIGVLPENSPFDRARGQIWLPLSFSPDRMTRSSHWLLTPTGGALGRLRPGVTIERARAETEAISARLSRDYPDSNRGWSAFVEPYSSIVVSTDLSRSLDLLLAAVALLLLMGCVNLANLMLARALARDREVSVRAMLGAGRRQLIQQFLTESLLVATAGGALGVVVAYALMQWLMAALAGLPLNRAMAPFVLPAEATVRLNASVMTFALALSVISSVLFGLAPAIVAARAVNPPPTRFRAPFVHRRIRGVLVVAEVALAFVLLVAAGLLFRSLLNMRAADTGFEAANVLTAEIPTRDHRFADEGQYHVFVHQVVERIEALPGVQAVAFTDGMPMQGAPTLTFFQIVGLPVVERARRPASDLRVVSPSYFSALGLRLRRGRALSDLDREGTLRVAVINETMARMYFQQMDPVGRQLLMNQPGLGVVVRGKVVPWEIVGVIADEQLTSFDDKEPHPAVYVSNEQSPTAFAGIVMRTSLDPSGLANALRRAVADVDKEQPVTDVKTLERLKAESMIPDMFRSSLLGMFAVVALFLSAIGIYGVVSFSVARRTREIGIRTALGASPAHAVRLVFGGGMSQAGLGLALGVAAALAVSRSLSAFLFGVDPFDSVTFVAVAGVLTTIAAGACYLPARRAARIEAVHALRAD